MSRSCRHHTQGLNLFDVSLVLQAVGVANAEAAIPAAQPASNALKAVANPGSDQPAHAPHHASPVPAEPVPNRQGRRRTRHSADAELLGQTRGNASISPTPAEAPHGGPITARKRRSSGLAPAKHPPVQEAIRHKRKSGAAAGMERAKKVIAEQHKAAPSSPAVAPAAAGQGQKAGQGRPDQQDRRGRAAPSSPALSSPGGTNFRPHSVHITASHS